ncbi:MAG: sodium:calcium antiporter [Chloroflexi bacterium]|nr:sodium:calcium antiporter [Chloroflexota bacterium]
MGPYVEARTEICHSEPAGEESVRHCTAVNGSFASLRMTGLCGRADPLLYAKLRSDMIEVILLVVAFALLVVGAEYFTNAVEWLGHHLKLSDSATGSLLAAVGTAMPETLVPIVAIISALGQPAADAELSKHVGIGGILGAPFMLSTLAMLVIATALWSYRKRRQTTHLRFNAETAESDLKFFLIAYTLGFIAAFIPSELIVIRWAIAASLIPLYFIYMRRLLVHSEPVAGSAEELGPLHLLKHLNRLPFEVTPNDPHLSHILAQVAFSLGLIIGGAYMFVGQIQTMAVNIGIAPLVLSLLITPVATELPEKLNSVLWIRRGKDTLAFGNMSGALVFQSAFPVTIGILFTDWRLSLDPASPFFLPALSCVLALLSGASLLYFVHRHDTLHVPHLLASGTLYVVFVIAVILVSVMGPEVAVAGH